MSAAASEIMSTHVISVTMDSNVGEAVELFAKNSINGLPVVDKENRVVGMITERDVLEYSNQLHVIPLIAFSGWVSPYTDVTNIAFFEKGFKSLLTTKVEKVMSKKVVMVRKDTPVHEITSLMIQKEVNRVPVVDEAGRLIGIIARSDIIQYLASQEDEGQIITSGVL